MKKPILFTTKLSLIYRNLPTALLFLFSFPATASAQLSVIENQPLSFGTFSFVDMADVLEITIDTANNVTSTANVALIAVPTSGEYTISGGTPGAVYVTLAETSVSLNGDGPGSFTMDNIVIDPTTSSFDGFGDTNIAVGGRLRSSGGGVQYGNGAYTQNTPITIAY